jgi:hypothetical protein
MKQQLVGPFRNLSDLSSSQAESVMNDIRKDSSLFASGRSADYLEIRRHLEMLVRQMFINKGGKPIRERPHYMVLGFCPWLKTWYQNGAELRIPLADFEPEIVSFTYGDTFPAMRYEDGKLVENAIHAKYVSININ